MPALYASLSVMTALREANQVGNLQPTTLVSYDAEIDGVFDCRDEDALKAEGMDAAALADSDMARPDEGERRGEDASLCPALDRRRLSCACWSGASRPGATGDDLNLVLWRWGASAPVAPDL